MDRFFSRGLLFFYSNRLEAYFHQATFFRRKNAILTLVFGFGPGSLVQNGF